MSPDASDPFDLDRFVRAQEPVIERVRAELADGRKRGHWMWFVFPQIAGLSFSDRAVRYAIGSVEEASAYLAQPLLGTRLRDCTELVLLVEGTSAHAIFGSPDDMKFRSSMTLFAEVSREEVFLRALDRYFDGAADPLTLERLASLDG